MDWGWSSALTTLLPVPPVMTAGPMISFAAFLGFDLQPGLGGVCAVGELAATGVAGGPVLRRGGWFDPALIHPSAESLH